jgi:hypothetical protein
MKYDIANLNETRPSRRAVVRTAAWSVPVIAVATTAPAFAASPCDARTNQVLDWDAANAGYSRTSDTAAKASLVPATNVPVLTVDIAASYGGNMKPGYELTSSGTTNPSLRLASAIGGLGISGVSLWQNTTSASPQGYNDIGRYTFTFSREVSNLRFTITDIDYASGDFKDALQITGAAYTVTSRGAGVIQASDATFGRYFIANESSGASNNATGSAGNLELKFAGPVKTFTISYVNALSGSFTNGVDTDQTIYVSDMTFDYKPC